MKKRNQILVVLLMSLACVMSLSSCDNTMGEKIGLTCDDIGISHIGKWETTVEPTCTSEGEESRICSICGTSETRAVAVIEHDMDPFPEKLPTCTEPGYPACDRCTKCDFSDAQVIPMLGHAEIHHNGVKPTCAEGGYADYITCERCDYSTYEELLALGHDEIPHQSVSATCTVAGCNDYVTCSRCDYSTYVELSALGHDEIAHQGVPATCTATGYKDYVTCSRCDYSTYAELEALGHDEITHQGVSATCTATGYKDYVTCSRCDYSTYSELEALGHDMVLCEKLAATCTTSGYEAYDACSRCDYEGEKVILEPLGHDEITHQGKAATCTAVGYNDYVTCSRCDYSTYSELEALGHDEQLCEGLAATCTTSGYEPYYACSRCSYESEKVVIKSLGHDKITHEAVTPTCEIEGNSAYETCSRCSYSTYKSLGFAPHTEAVLPEVKPTYTTTGLTEGTYCTVCEKTINPQQVIPLVGIFTAAADNSVKGTVSISGCDAIIGTSVEIVANANDGYRFVGWFDGDKIVSLRPDYVFAMPDSRYSLTARFESVGAAWDGSVATAFAGGDGTYSNPYLIANGAQLARIGVIGTTSGKYFRIVANIDLGGEDWTPIKNFYGYLNGDGYTIYGLKITNAVSVTNIGACAGLFTNVGAALFMVLR